NSDLVRLKKRVGDVPGMLEDIADRLPRQNGIILDVCDNVFGDDFRRAQWHEFRPGPPGLRCTIAEPRNRPKYLGNSFTAVARSQEGIWRVLSGRHVRATTPAVPALCAESQC